MKYLGKGIGIIVATIGISFNTYYYLSYGYFEILSVLCAIIVSILAFYIGVEFDQVRVAKEKTEENERKLRSYIDSSPVAIFSINVSGSFSESNSAGCSLLGYEKEEILQKNIRDVLPPEEVDNFNKLITKGKIKTETVWRKKDGSRLEVELNAVKVSEDNYNDAGQIIVICHDITEKKRVAENFAKMEKLESIGHLAGGIAHDFNNLLTVIVGNTSLAQVKIRHLASDKKGAILDLLDNLTEAANQAQEITGQFITFSQGGAPNQESVSFQEILNEAAPISLKGLKGSDISLQYSIPHDLWLLDIDKIQITQVIKNIISNAQETMPNVGGVIKISAENVLLEETKSLPLNKGRYIKISFKDHGIGIPASNINKVFDPYFTTKEMRNGLGLSIVHSIVKRHKGHITIESQPGIETIVDIYLPASSEQLSFKF